MSNRIKELRIKAGLSQTQLAKLIVPETSWQQIQKLENGNRRLAQDWMMRIADALGVHPSDLLPPHEVKKSATLSKTSGFSEPTDAIQIISAIEKLADLNRSGKLTDAEFNFLKSKIIQ